MVKYLEWEPATYSRRAVPRSAARSAPLMAPLGAPSVFFAGGIDPLIQIALHEVSSAPRHNHSS